MLFQGTPETLVGTEGGDFCMLFYDIPYYSKALQRPLQAPRELICSCSPETLAGNTHHTHKIAVLRGLVYCSKRGSYTTGKHLIKLSKKCEGPTPHGLRALEAVAEDRLPLNVRAWPEALRSSHSASSSGG